ncbi:polymer-forming cytoskeletal protein [uncultured Kocuria sp.]|uniref:bactofilin family protein n=1 Tax=uncultured Kocuria sp. TaxID=259305 RepID=UPI00261031DF|nr:polymer-forming cytoskeletal protein [uncultured Kocuria sp.]
METQPVPRTSPVPFLLRLPTLLTLLALLATALAGVLLTAPAAGAAEIRGEENVVVAADEVVDDDLYVTGGDVVVDGTVRGDLLVAGGTVTVNGTVEGDLMAAAQTVVIEGTVGDDARVASQVLLLGEQARVADDLVTAGYSLETRPGAEIGGDVLLGAYQALLAGTIDGDVTAGAAALALAGAIGGDVQADVGSADEVGAAWAPTTGVTVPQVDPGLTVTDAARLDGDLSYRSGTEAAIAPGAEIAGEVVYDPVVVEEDPAAPAGPLALLIAGLRLFVTLFVVGLLALWLLPRTLNGAAGTLRSRPWLSLGWGALAVAGTAVALLAVLVVSILLAIALGWLTLAGLAAAVVATGVVLDLVLVLGLVLAVALLAPVVVGYTTGGLLLRDPAPAGFGKRVLALALGLLIYVLLRAVPFLGPVVALLVALFGVGALVVWAWDAARRGRARRRADRDGYPGTAPGDHEHAGAQRTGSWPAGAQQPGPGQPGSWQTGPGQPGSWQTGPGHTPPTGQPLQGRPPQGSRAQESPQQTRPPWSGDGAGHRPPPEPPR